MMKAIPLQLRLDNAANIYPASLSKKYSSLYRMSVTLTEPVDAAVLQEALAVVSERIPTFRCGLRSGAFWWYLNRLDGTPRVLPLSPLRRQPFREQGGFLYRVSADGERIVLDVFHALTDGSGALTFLLTLTGEYLRRRYGIDIPYDSRVLDPSREASWEEVEDSFKTTFTGRKGTLEKNDDAYHIRGMKLMDSGLRDLRIVLDEEQIAARCRKHDCTVTELLTAALLSALQEEHLRDPRPDRCPVLKVTVPVNLRPMYGSRTLRNFSSYVNLGVDVEDGYFSMNELIEFVREQKEWALRRENLEPKIAANVELEENFAVRCIPLFIKRPVIDLINRLHGDRFCSTTLSNLGRIRLSGQMRNYVKDMDFVLGRQRGNSGAASCLSYGGNLYLHLSRGIFRDDFEKHLLEVFRQLGLHYRTTSSVLA